MTDGRSDRWVRFYVKALDNPAFNSMSLATTRLFMVCLARANWCEKKWCDGRSHIMIPRGSFITSTAKLGAEFGMSRQQTRDALENLRNLEIVTIKGTSKWSMLTVSNYDTYQPLCDFEEPAEEPAKNQRENQRRNQRKNHNLITLREEKEENPLPPLAAGGEFMLAPSNGSGKLLRKPRRHLGGIPLATIRRWMEEFKIAYPLTDCRQPSERAFRAAVTSPEIFEAIMKGIRELRGGLHKDPEFWPFASRWFNEERWKWQLPARLTVQSANPNPIYDPTRDGIPILGELK